MSAGSLGSAQAEILIDISKALQSLTQFSTALRQASNAGNGAFENVSDDAGKAGSAVKNAAEAVNDASDAIDGAGRAMDNAGDAMADTANDARTADTSMDNAAGAATDLGNAAAAASPKVKSLGDRGQELARQWDDAGKSMVAAGTAITATVGGSIWVAGSFEAAMSGVKASLMDVNDGVGVTTEEFKALSAEALRIGAETSMGANDAAAAMEMMAKSGVSLESILNGGAQAAVNIAEATGESLPQSADTMSAMLNLFDRTGISAEEMADTIVNGMNASQATMSEFQTGMARMAPAILATGMSAQEAAGLIAYFNAQGFSAAATGTALAGVYTRLVSPSNEAAAAIKELGLEAFDSQGKFVGYPALFDQVRDATAGMSDQARDAYLATIFGAEGLDVMTMAALEGGDALQGVTDDMYNTGTAAEASAIRMDNWQGSLEELSGTIETIAITVGQKFLPAVNALTKAVTSVLGLFLVLPGPIQAAAAVLTAFSGVALLAGGTAVLALPRLMQMAESYGHLSTAIRTRAIPALKAYSGALRGLVAAHPVLFAAIALITLALAAYQSNFLGFGDAVRAVASRVAAPFKALADTFMTFYNALRAGNEMVAGVGRLEAVFGALASTIYKLTGVNLAASFSRIASAARGAINAVDKITGGFRAMMGAWTGSDISYGRGIDGLRKSLTGIGDLLASPLKAVGGFLRNIETGFKPLDVLIQSFGARFVDMGRLIQEIMQGDVFGSIRVLQRLLLGSLTAVPRAILSVLDQIFGTDLLAGFDGVLNGVRDKLARFTDAAEAAWGKLKAFYDIFRTGNEMVGGLGRIESAFLAISALIANLTGYNLREQFQAAADAANAIWNAVKKIAGGLFEAFGALLSGDLNKAWASFQKAVAGLGDLLGAPAKLIGNLLRSIKTGFAPLDAMFGNLARVWTNLGRLVQEIFQGDLQGALAVARRLLDSFVDTLASMGRLLVETFRAIDWGALLSGLGDLAGRVLESIGNLGGRLWSWFKDAIPDAETIKGFFTETVPDVTATVLAKLGEWGTKIWGWIKDALPSGETVTSFFTETIPDVTGAVLTKLGAWGTKITDWLKDALPGAATVTGFFTEIVPDVTSAIIGKFGDLATKISDWISGAIPDDWSSFFTGITVPDIPGLDTLETALDAIKSVATWIGDNIAEKLGALTGIDFTPPVAFSDFSGVLDAIQGTAGTIFEAIDDAAGKISGLSFSMPSSLTTLKDTLATIVSEAGGIAGKLGEITAAVAGMVFDIPGGLIDLVNKMIEGAAAAADWVKNLPIINRFTSDGGGGETDTSDNGYGYPDGRPAGPYPVAVEAPELVIPTISLDLFLEQLTSIPTKVAEQMQAALTTATAFSEAIGTVIGVNLGNLVANTGALMGAVATAVGENMSTALGAASTYAEAIGTVTGNALGRMVGNTNGLMAGFTRTVGQGMSNALGVAATYASGIVTAVSNNLGGMHGIGLNATQALASGMLGAIAAVRSAAFRVGMEARRGVESALEISSPSRVFMAIGRYVDEGLAMGMTGNLNTVRSAAGDVARAAMIGVDLRGAQGFGGLPARGATTNITQNVFQVMPEELQQLMVQAQDAYGFAVGFERELGLRL